jgi:hypothetical protein
MAIELLATNIELGLVTTNLDAMVGFYEGFGPAAPGRSGLSGRHDAALRHRQQRAQAGHPRRAAGRPRHPAAVPPRPVSATTPWSSPT